MSMEGSQEGSHKPTPSATVAQNGGIPHPRTSASAAQTATSEGSTTGATTNGPTKQLRPQAESYVPKTNVSTSLSKLRATAREFVPPGKPVTSPSLVTTSQARPVLSSPVNTQAQANHHLPTHATHPHPPQPSPQPQVDTPTASAPHPPVVQAKQPSSPPRTKSPQKSTPPPPPPSTSRSPPPSAPASPKVTPTAHPPPPHADEPAASEEKEKPKPVVNHVAEPAVVNDKPQSPPPQSSSSPSRSPPRPPPKKAEPSSPSRSPPPKPPAPIATSDPASHATEHPSASSGRETPSPVPGQREGGADGPPPMQPMPQRAVKTLDDGSWRSRMQPLPSPQGYSSYLDPICSSLGTKDAVKLPVPASEGTTQFSLSDLLRLRQSMMDATGTGQLPRVDVTWPLWVKQELLVEYNPDTPSRTASVSPALSINRADSITPSQRGGPRPRSAGVSTSGDGSAGGPQRGGDSGAGLNRTNSRGFADDRRKGGGGKRRAKSPPPLVDVDGYAPKRIEDEKRWKSSRSRGAPIFHPEDPEKRIMKARSILNKLSLENFGKLSDEFVDVGFTSEELLRRAIDIIVSKAQEEVHFSSMYAELCLKLSRTPLVGLGETEKGRLFRRILLTRCQDEFHKDLAERLAEFDSLPQDERKEKQFVAKKRYLGHMRFVGELFLKELLKEDRVHDCILHLFGEEDSADEEKLECLCKLLSTTGKKLEALAETNPDEQKGKKQRKLIDRYFKEVLRLSEDSKNLTSRTRFLLKDLYELRQNNYVPRRAVESAKTLSQVHAEAAREVQAKGGGEKAKRRPTASRGGSDGGSQDVRSQSGLTRSSSSTEVKLEKQQSTVDDDGWETVSTKKFSVKGSLQRSSSTASLTKGKSSGSFGGAFAALAGDTDKDKDKSKKKKDKDRKDLSASGKGEKKDKSKKDKKKEKKQDRKEGDDEDFSGDGERTDDDDNEEDDAPPLGAQNPKPAMNGKALTGEDLKRKSHAILSEYLHIKDTSEAIACFRELNVDTPEMVGYWVDDVVERKKDDAALLADLLIALHAENLITSQQLGASFVNTLEFLPDTKVDVPQADGILALLLGRLMCADALSLSYLQAPPEALVESGCAADFAVKVVKEIKAREGAGKASSLWSASKLDLKPLLPPNVEDKDDEAQRLLDSLEL